MQESVHSLLKQVSPGAHWLVVEQGPPPPPQTPDVHGTPESQSPSSSQPPPGLHGHSPLQSELGVQKLVGVSGVWVKTVLGFARMLFA
jgi:hypothetical protein